MLDIRKADQRGRGEHGWLSSRHSFSFAQYFDPQQVGFSDLLVINDDRVAPGRGFGKHPHRDMEIFSYVLEGALEHADTMGTGSVIRPGDVQLMSAGTGVAHSEYNHSKSEPVHFMQIWIMPSKNGLPPSYEQKMVDAKAVTNKFARIASPEPQPNEVRLVQDAEIWAAKLDADVEAIHNLGPGRRAWVQVTKGEVSIDTQLLSTGDGAAVTDQAQIALRSRTPAELLLFDLA